MQQRTINSLAALACLLILVGLILTVGAATGDHSSGDNIGRYQGP